MFFCSIFFISLASCVSRECVWRCHKLSAIYFSCSFSLELCCVYFFSVLPTMDSTIYSPHELVCRSRPFIFKDFSHLMFRYYDGIFVLFFFRLVFLCCNSKVWHINTFFFFVLLLLMTKMMAEITLITNYLNLFTFLWSAIFVGVCKR